MQDRLVYTGMIHPLPTYTIVTKRMQSRIDRHRLLQRHHHVLETRVLATRQRDPESAELVDLYDQLLDLERDAATLDREIAHICDAELQRRNQRGMRLYRDSTPVET